MIKTIESGILFEVVKEHIEKIKYYESLIIKLEKEPEIVISRSDYDDYRNSVILNIYYADLRCN